MSAESTLRHAFGAAPHVGVNYSSNIVVIKTAPGWANALAAALDGMSYPDVVGILAGDDTIIAIAPDRDTAINITERLRALATGKA
jgi:transcriptional regulator of arginine metabolism